MEELTAAVAALEKVMGIYSLLGPTATIVVVGVVLFFILREMKRQTSDLKTSITSLKKQSDDADTKLADQLQKLDDKIDYVEKNSVSRETYYKDLGGWRTDISELRKLLVDSLTKERK